MNNIKKVFEEKEIDLFKWIFSILITIVISISGVLYANQNKKIDSKVDNSTLKQIIIRLDEKNKTIEKEEQKLYNQNLNQQKVNIQIIKILEEIKTKVKEK